jgi:hypothetical protein
MHDSKICFKCNVEKPLSDFYKHKGMADGYLNKCKECNKKDASENRKANIDYYLEYDKQRASNPNRINYHQTEAGKLAHEKSRKKWRESNLIKQAASKIVTNAVRNKKLEKKDTCEVCNVSNVKIHGHHDDYAFPLSVRWLCPKCHSNWHKEHGSAKNG